MSLERIHTSIQTLFTDDRRWAHIGRRLVFWYDPHGAFQAEFEALNFENIRKVALEGMFGTKYALLALYPQDACLVYAPHPPPASGDNWLYDLEQTALFFEADRAGMLHADLGLLERGLVSTLRRFESFFASQKRLASVRALLTPDAREPDLELALMCALAGLKVSDAGLLVRRVLGGGLEQDQNALYGELVRFALEDAFWDAVGRALGYRSERATLRRLFMALQLSHLQNGWPSLPRDLATLTVQPSSRAVVFVDQWMQHAQDGRYWRELAGALEPDLYLEKPLKAAGAAHYVEADTFAVLDRALLSEVSAALLRQGADLSGLGALLETRRSSLWYPDYAPAYRCLGAALDFYRGLAALPPRFEGSATHLLERYSTQWYTLDRAYRTFVTDYSGAEGVELSVLSDALEKAYLSRFLEPLNEAYGVATTLEGGRNIRVGGASWTFYRSHVEPILQRGERERVVVLISDALRWEIGLELAELLRSELRGEVDATPLLSPLPSVTHWGMAALLPGNTLSLAPTGGVLRDGQSTAGLEARQKILAGLPYPATALRLRDLLALGTEEARETLKPHRLIYLYHDQIDAAGDKAASEHGVFEAAQGALETLVRAVKRLVNNLNVNRVLITADHGFLYQRSPVSEADKRPMPRAPEGGALLETNRRYVLGPALDLDEGVREGSPEGRLVALELSQFMPLPQPLMYGGARGNLRFALQGGGSQYVHGGPSLQERVIPLLSYRHVRAVKGDGGLSRKVELTVRTPRTLTNATFTVLLQQLEEVGDRVRPRTVRIGLYDLASGRAITGEPTVALESASSYPTEREYPVRLTAAPGRDPALEYVLRIVDLEDDHVLFNERISLQLAFPNLFEEL